MKALTLVQTHCYGALGFYQHFSLNLLAKREKGRQKTHTRALESFALSTHLFCFLTQLECNVMLQWKINYGGRMGTLGSRQLSDECWKLWVDRCSWILKVMGKVKVGTQERGKCLPRIAKQKNSFFCLLGVFERS